MLNKDVLKAQYGITQEQFETVLRFCGNNTKEIISGETIKRLSATEIKKAAKEFQVNMGVLFLKDIEKVSDTFAKALGTMLWKGFRYGSKDFNFLNDSIYFVSAPFMQYCMKHCLTETEYQILILKYGFKDGNIRSLPQIKKEMGQYTMYMVRNRCQRAENKMMYWAGKAHMIAIGQ